MKNKLLHNPIFTSKKVLRKISEQIPAISEWEELNLWPSVPKTDILPLYDTLNTLSDDAMTPYGAKALYSIRCLHNENPS